MKKIYLIAFLNLLAIGLIPKIANAQKWDSVGLGFNYGAQVQSLGVYNGNLYAGGWITKAGGITVQGIAQWNGTSWANVGAGLGIAGQGLYVNSLVEYNGSLYAGGAFQNAGSVVVNNVAKWNGSNWDRVGSGNFGYQIFSLAVYNDSLYAAGVSSISKWNGTKWDSIGSGAWALTAYNGSLYAVGLHGLSKWNGARWDDSVGSGIYNNQALTEYNGSLYVGGNGIIKWNGSGWDSIGTDMRSGSSVMALAVYNGSLYAGGFFKKADGISYDRILKWNGSRWDSLGRGIDGTVSELAVYNGSLYVGGSITKAGEITVNGIAKWTSPATDIEETVLNKSVYIYPNPSDQKINIHYQGKPTKDFAIKVFSTEGKLIYSEKHTQLAGENNYTIDLSSQAKGLYIMQVITDNENISRKIVLE